MKDKKKGARQKADEFLAVYGTAGGPIGSPGLVQFGAGDTANQVMSGNIDEYGAIRQEGTGSQIGDQQVAAPAMPRDLESSYLKLNLPGSPLPTNGLFTPQMLSTAEIVQNQIMTDNQLEMIKNMRPVGQLMLGNLPQTYDQDSKK